MGKTLLYNPNDGDVRITSTSEGSPSGKWEKFMEGGYLPIAKVYGYNVTIEPNNVLVNTLPVGSQISNSEINEDKKYKDMKRIKLKASDINHMVKRVIKEGSDTHIDAGGKRGENDNWKRRERWEYSEEEQKEWDKLEERKQDIFEDIYDTLEPVLNNILDKYGEDFDLIANDEMIQNIVEDWMYSGDED